MAAPATLLVQRVFTSPLCDPRLDSMVKLFLPGGTQFYCSGALGRARHHAAAGCQGGGGG